MGWFFSKAALVTFGCAYAVLPYIYQGAVDYYGWLSPLQMIDGLALGEANPGPLIMVVAFIGFVGAYVQALFGPEMVFVAGVMGAVLVRSEEHPSELQSLMRSSYAVFCLKKKKITVTALVLLTYITQQLKR